MKKIISMLLVLVLALSLFAGCTQPSIDSTTPSASTKPSSSGNDTTPPTEKPMDKEDMPVLSIYPNTSLSAGVMGGHKSDFFAKYNFQAEIWAYSEEKTNAILVSGDLPDIMYVPVGDTLDTLIKTGKVLCLDDYLDDIPSLSSVEFIDDVLKYVRNVCSADTGSVYGLPLAIGTNGGKYGIFDSTSGQPVKLNWEVYEQIGAPEIKDHWDLIDVMEEMLKAKPTHEDGGKMYGTVLNGDSDGAYFGNMNWWMNSHAYHYNQLKYLCELNMETSKASSILTKDSLYYEGLKWFNELNRRGLMDPDSISLDTQTQVAKVDTGHVMVPSGNLVGWQGGGFYEYLLPGSKIYYPETAKIAQSVVVINAETEHLEECLAFLDILCNPDASFELTYGPSGDMWYTENGKDIFLTDEYIAWRNAGNPINGFPMSDGSEWSAALVLPTVFSSGAALSYEDGNGNKRPYGPDAFSELVAGQMENDTFKKWQKTTGYETWREWLADKDALIGNADFDNYRGFSANAVPAGAMEMTQATCKDIVVTASWLMIYAKTDAEFDAIWDQMVKDCMAAGAQEMIDWRINDLQQAYDTWLDFE